MSDLTPLKAAEKMETAGDLLWKNDEVGIFKITKDDAKVFQTALYYLRKIAAGELRPVVRCEECIYQERCKRFISVLGADSVHPLTYCSYGKRKAGDPRA